MKENSIKDIDKVTGGDIPEELLNQFTNLVGKADEIFNSVKLCAFCKKHYTGECTNPKHAQMRDADCTAYDRASESFIRNHK